MTHYERTARASAGAMLLSERRALVALRKSTRAALGDLSLTIGAFGNSKAMRPWAIASVGQATKALGQQTSSALLTARGDARKVALERVRIEGGLAVPPSDAAEDLGLSNMAGASYASAWGNAVMGEVLRWADDPSGTPKLQAASATQDYRLARTAATEVSRAYNDEHGEAVRLLRGPGLTKRWEAILDKMVCKVCRALDGQVVPVNAPFKNGLEPGMAHPLCRCIEVLIGQAVSVDTEVRPYRPASSKTFNAAQGGSPSGYTGGGGTAGGGGSTDSY